MNLIFAQVADTAPADSLQSAPDYAERLRSIVVGSGAFWSTPWFREIGLMLLVAFLAWLPARALVAWMRSRRPERSEQPLWARGVRAILDSSVWPVMSMAIFAPALAAGQQFFPEYMAQTWRVLPILGFFLLYRTLSGLLFEFVSPGPTRRRLRRVALPGVFFLAILQQLALLEPFLSMLRYPFLRVGEAPLSLISVLGSVLLFLAFVLGSRTVSRFMSSRFLPGLGLDRGLSDAISTVAKYVLITVGVLFAFSSLGFDLSVLSFAFGALGVGIGFGLQNIVNNFTSGLILLFERSVKRGDILEIGGGTHGQVMEVGLRSSILRTREGHDLIVPNSHLVENQVTNFSYRDTLKRVDLNVGVSYSSKPQQVQELLLKAAEGMKGIRTDHPPTVVFLSYGDSSLDFQLRVWTDEPWVTPMLQSELHFRVWDILKENGVEIPFPQRDLHIRSGVLPIRKMEAED